LRSLGTVDLVCENEGVIKTQKDARLKLVKLEIYKNISERVPYSLYEICKYVKVLSIQFKLNIAVYFGFKSKVHRYTITGLNHTRLRQFSTQLTCMYSETRSNMYF